MLNNGDRVQGQFGGQVAIDHEVGSGTQGVVFLARAANGDQVAVKWFYPDGQTDAVRNRITDLVVRGAPSPYFLWPDDVVSSGPEFGYVMPLRPPDYVNIPRILRRKVDISFRQLLCASSQTVAAFKALQAEGLFYGDISAANLFLNPLSGDVLIGDTDNVGSTKLPPLVLGTPRYMAPEIVRGESKPSPLTDSFSMSVLLFLLLMNDHPLDGALVNKIHAFDAAAMQQVYGEAPVFIFDPIDRSNRPEPGVQRNAEVFWGIYPQAVRDVFTSAFTRGLNDPGNRPSFTEWQRALAVLEDARVVCGGCRQDNFWTASGATECWHCHAPVDMPMRLVMDGRRHVNLNADRRLYLHHVTRYGGDPGAPGEPIAKVCPHPALENVWGLTNLSSSQWFATLPDGATQSIAPGRTVMLVPGTEVNFGEVSGTVSA